MTELEFGERLKQYRKARGLTQQELADLLGVSNKSVSRWESGSYPDVATLGPLAHALGVTVDDLLGVAPPLRSLGRADWQNWLSFAFAIGGGVLFFLLDLFAPTLVCYLLYLGAMAYGVYLQKHYTYHSKWFHRANLAMNFFVNLQLLGTVFSIAVQLTALNTAWQEVLTPTWRDLGRPVPRPVRPAGQLWDGVDTSAPLAAVRPRAHLSHLAVHPQQAGRRAPAGRAPAGARPLRLVQTAPRSWVRCWPACSGASIGPGACPAGCTSAS